VRGQRVPLIGRWEGDCATTGSETRSFQLVGSETVAPQPLVFRLYQSTRLSRYDTYSLRPGACMTCKLGLEGIVCKRIDAISPWPVEELDQGQEQETPGNVVR